MVEGVEEFATGFEVEAFVQVEAADDGEVHGLHAGTADGVSAGVAEVVGGRRAEGRGIEPGAGGAGAWAKDGLPGHVGADGIFTERGAGVGGVAEDRDGHGEAALDLGDA